MRFLVSCGMEAAPGESFNTSERVVGDSFRCFASSLRLIARPAEASFRPVPGLLWSGTVGVSHKSARGPTKNDFVWDFTEKLLDKRPACRLFCQSGKTIYQVRRPADGSGPQAKGVVSMTTFVRNIPIVLAVALILQFFAPPAAAQYNAGLQGTVTDPNGGVVPEAKVTLTSQETGFVHSVTSTGQGVYSITGLAPGKYSLSVEKAGFSKKVLSEVVISAEIMQSVNVPLEIGQTTQSITVEAPVAPLIDTETAMIGGTLTAKEVAALPAFGRDPYKLLSLAPGVFGDGALSNGGGAASLPGSNVGAAGATDSIFKVENGAQFVANGTRQNSNNFEIDGVPVNSASWGGAAVVTPSEESVKEVRVIANNYSAENGRTSGAQVEVVSQNGTNDYHGSAFFKWHRPGLNAYQAWNGPGTPSPVQKDENRFNQFGGSVGGPIKRNKLFAFFSYETLRNNSVNVATGWYETSQFLQSAGPSGSIARKLLSYP